MTPYATLLFASLLTLLYLYLTWQVIGRRRKHRIAYGAPAEHPDLQVAIRAHGNFQEYTPLFLILLYLTETVLQLQWLCYVLGFIFLCGRISHAYSLLHYEGKMISGGARMRLSFRFRFYAMVQTLVSLGTMAVLMLIYLLMHL